MSPAWSPRTLAEAREALAQGAVKVAGATDARSRSPGFAGIFAGMACRIAARRRCVVVPCRWAGVGSGLSATEAMVPLVTTSDSYSERM